MKDQRQLAAEMARGQEEIRRLQKDGLILDQQEVQRLFAEYGTPEVAGKIRDVTRRTREAFLEMGLLDPDSQERPTSAIHDDPTLGKLKVRIHGRVPADEEFRLLNAARKLIVDSREWIPSTDLRPVFQLPPKTIWGVFSQQDHKGHVQGKRPCSYLREALLKYVFEDYWPRGCPTRSPQTKSRNPQTKAGTPQTRKAGAQT